LWLRQPSVTLRLRNGRAPNPAVPRECITLGDHIRKKRIERKQSQSHLAKSFKVTADTVTNWELNRNNISRLYYPIIEEYLGYLPIEITITDMARKLISYRWKYSLSIKRLASELGVDYTILTKAEKGDINFQKPTLKRLHSLRYK